MQLKIERDLITQGNFTWYDPIRKATSLVLDGQTLINLEVSEVVCVHCPCVILI